MLRNGRPLGRILGASPCGLTDFFKSSQSPHSCSGSHGVRRYEDFKFAANGKLIIDRISSDSGNCIARFMDYDTL